MAEKSVGGEREKRYGADERYRSIPLPINPAVSVNEPRATQLWPSGKVIYAFKLSRKGESIMSLDDLDQWQAHQLARLLAIATEQMEQRRRRWKKHSAPQIAKLAEVEDSRLETIPRPAASSPGLRVRPALVRADRPHLFPAPPFRMGRSE